MPLITVIIPVYNVDKYLKQCVLSVLEQTLEEFEIILVNDGSTDNSGFIAENLAQKDNRIKVVHKKNEGPSSARNTGIRLAQGKYISFIDSDDWVESIFLEKLYKGAIKNNADIVITGITVNFLKENRIKILKYPNELYSRDKSQFGNLFWELNKLKLSNYPVTRLFKKSFLTEYKILFDVDVFVGEDLLFNLKAFKNAHAIYISNEAHYHYMKRELKTLTSCYNPNLKLETKKQINAYKEFFEFYHMKNKEYEQFLNRKYIGAYLGLLMNLYKKNSKFTSKERLFIIRREVFENNTLALKLRSTKLSGFNNKLFYFLYKYTNHVVMEFVYEKIFLLRNKLENLYLKFRFLFRE